MTTTLPSPLRVRSHVPLVGREPELTALRAGLPGAEATLSAVLLAGEPGSGKSRLVRELAARAAEGGVRVIYGACDSEVAAPYGPFAQALGQLAAPADPLAGAFTRTPPLGEDVSRGASGDPDAERLRLHRAAAAALASAAASAPLLVVLEDVHWADGASAALLRSLVREPPSERILIVATYRDATADVGPDLAAVVGELRRSEPVLHMRLAGLSVGEIDRWIRHAASLGEAGDLGDLPAGLAALTGGNPFLLGEVWRTLQETGALTVAEGRVTIGRPLESIASPEGVRDVVAGRLGRLVPGTRAVLECAAVAGPEFRVDVLDAALSPVGGSAPVDLSGALAAAESLAMIEPASPPGVAYRFAHELVRRAVVDRMPTPRRAELHLRVAEALEALGSAGAADLAHHFTAAAGVGGRERAVEYGVAAAREAAAAAAHEAAAEHLARVVDLVPPGPERAELVLELGAEQTRAGDLAAALDTFSTAAGLARAQGDAGLLARAAIGFEEACWRPGIADAGAVELLREAEGALPGPADGLRARVRTGLSRALAYQGHYGHAAEIAAEAVAEARSEGTEKILAQALIGTFFASGGRAAAEVAEALAEAREIAGRTGDRELAIEAATWRVVVLTRLGDTAGAHEELDGFRRAGEAAGLPFALHVAAQFEASLALAEGRLDDAETNAELSLRWGELLRARDVSGSHGIQMFNLRREQGRLGELAPVARLLAAGADSAWRPGLVALLAETGFRDEARAELGSLIRSALPSLTDGGVATAGLAYLTEAAFALDDREAALALRPILADRGGEVLMVGNLVACLGSADRLVGMLAATAGELDAAVEHLERGIARDAELGFRTWVAWGAHALARTLLERRAAGDRERATTLDERAAEVAGSLGLAALVTRIGAAPPPVAAPAPDDLSPRELVVLRLIAAGRSNREIGVELVISEHTAANHVRSILRKTGSANRTEAADYAHRRKLVNI